MTGRLRPVPAGAALLLHAALAVGILSAAHGPARSGSPGPAGFVRFSTVEPSTGARSGVPTMSVVLLRAQAHPAADTMRAVVVAAPRDRADDRAVIALHARNARHAAAPAAALRGAAPSARAQHGTTPPYVAPALPVWPPDAPEWSQASPSGEAVPPAAGSWHAPVFAGWGWRARERRAALRDAGLAQRATWAAAGGGRQGEPPAVPLPDGTHPVTVAPPVAVPDDPCASIRDAEVDDTRGLAPAAPGCAEAVAPLSACSLADRTDC